VQIHLPIGDGATAILEVPQDRLVAAYAGPGDPAESASALLRAAVTNPLGYPPLNQAILPGDRVTIAIDPELPQLAILINELLSDLLDAGCQASDLTLLVPRSEQRDELHAAWSEAWRRDVQVVVHDPDDEMTHAYLAATREGRPIYLQRGISDADVFLPIGVQRLETALDYRGIHGGWFPAFSNLEAQLRHQSPGNVEWQAHRRRRQQETEEAAWLLGVRLVVQVLPGPAGSIAGVWCGDCDEVSKAASTTCRKLWLQQVDRPAELVIAVLDAPAAEQSWGQIARALAMAAEAADDGGTIVLWTELSADPGPALKSLGEIEASEDEQRLALLKQRSADATAAKVIADCLDRGRVFLRSRLKDSVVEEIGLAPLHDPQELQRLVERAASCLVIGSAQHAGVQFKQTVEAS
jgi:nickel-dependent lactate racemase